MEPRLPWSTRQHQGRMLRLQKAKFQRWLSSLIASKIRRNINGALKTESKSASTQALIGCSIAKFKRHIEAQFRPGMLWENHGSVWHLDHVKPCCLFRLDNPRQQKKCFNYRNIQPLFAKENLQKGGRYTSKAIAGQHS